MKHLLLPALLMALLAAARPALAHPVPFSYVDVDLEPDALKVTVVAHIFDLGHDLNVTPAERLLDPAFLKSEGGAVADLVRGRLHLDADGLALPPAEIVGIEPLTDRQSVRIALRQMVARAPGVVGVTTAMFPYDPVHQTFLNFYERGSLTSQAILDGAHQHFAYYAGTRQGVFAVVRKFVPAGIHHILIGPDHLLFLVGLLLLGGSVSRLLLVVSSFTLAHSITLSLAALNIVSPPARIIEPAIALSIVYVGADNLMVGRGRDVRPWIAFGFGFIHGFGFANVLREMDLPRRALAALRSRSEWAGRQLAFAGSLVVIAAGTFWFIQRLFFPGGIS